jgi:hypothetical protein
LEKVTNFREQWLGSTQIFEFRPLHWPRKGVGELEGEIRELLEEII